MGKRTRVHQLIEAHGVLLAPGCHDALSARMLALAGFEVGFLSGYAVSATLLGRPDVGLLTVPEMTAVAQRICASSALPLLVDADTGGGGPLNVQRTVQDLIAVGASGCFLEDQLWPKKCGHMRHKRVIPAAEQVQKIRAARAAAGDREFFIVGRTDARASLGLEEAIARAKAYVAAGADASFVEAPHDDAELAAIGAETTGLRVANMIEGGATPLHTPAELAAMGFHLILHPVAPLYATVHALRQVYQQLREHGTTRDALPATRFAEVNQLLGLEEVYALEQRWASEE